MSERSIGWAFVGGQAALILGLVFLPSGDDFALADWLRLLVDIVFWLGCAISVIAGAVLGRSLTATPVPNTRATLRTNGPYRFVRHPIYTGVIMIVVALAVRSGNAIGLALGAATIGFFQWKASWEEARLSDRFPDYPAYAAHTPRFFPIPRRRPSRHPASDTE